jgi:hypothetical protein
VGAIFRAIEISQVFGLGVGAGAQTGNLQVTADRSITSIGFVSEGGGGRLILELGIPGLIVLLILAFLLALVLYRNFRLLRFLPPQAATLLLGLASFAIANIPLFISAAQLYSDPFVLIMMSLCLGSFLAVPALVSEHHRQRIHAYGQSAAQPRQPPLVQP